MTINKDVAEKADRLLEEKNRTTKEKAELENHKQKCREVGICYECGEDLVKSSDNGKLCPKCNEIRDEGLRPYW